MRKKKSAALIEDFSKIKLCSEVHNNSDLFWVGVVTVV
jgi:hypothetical protein